MKMFNVSRLVPITDWLPKYKSTQLSGDISAGLTVGVMLIPQGLAYAMIAGLPPVYGLYASLIPQIAYAIFGTSRQLSVGPVAMDSLLVAASVSVIAVEGTERYIAIAIMMAMLMGAFQLVFGLLRFGFLANFLARPVISGFTSAAALVIGASQIKHFIGVPLGNGSNFLDVMRNIALSLGQADMPTVIIGVLGVLAIVMIKKINKRFPGAILAMLAGVLLIKFAGIELQSVDIIGQIPDSLPKMAIPVVSYEDIKALLPSAIALALIAYMEAISISKAIHERHKGEYAIDSNQELVSLGLANLLGSFFGSYPTTGGFSRSAVNDQAGARTNLASLISAGVVGMTLLFLTPYFYHLPKAILAAIIMVAVYGLIDIKYPLYLWKISKEDFFMLLTTFVITLTFGIMEGIMAGIFVSLFILVRRTTKPHVASLGRLPGTRSYRNKERFDMAEERKDVLVLRHDAQLYFANIDNFIDKVRSEVEVKGKDLRLMVLHCVSISNIDATALQSLRELISELNGQGIGVYFSSLIGPARDFLHKTGFVEEVGEDNFFVDVQSAIDHLDNGARKRNKQMLSHALQTNMFKENEI